MYLLMILPMLAAQLIVIQNGKALKKLAVTS
jgi:hypothetical protein